MDFGLAFTYPFQDPDVWKKLLIAAVCMLIPVVGPFIVMGWGLEAARRVIQNDPTPLPELDFGKMLGTGFQGAVISFVWALPLIILSLPSSILPSLIAEMDDTLGIVMWVVVSCCGCLSFVYAIFMALLVPAALGKFLDEGSMGAAFKVGEIFQMVRGNIGPFLFVLLGALLGSLVASLGVIICVIGVFVTYAYFFAIYGHLIGQAYKTAKANVV